MPSFTQTSARNFIDMTLYLLATILALRSMPFSNCAWHHLRPIESSNLNGFVNMSRSFAISPLLRLIASAAMWRMAAKSALTPIIRPLICAKIPLIGSNQIDRRPLSSINSSKNYSGPSSSHRWLDRCILSTFLRFPRKAMMGA